MKNTYIIGQKVRVVKTDKLSGNEIGPPGLVMGEGRCTILVFGVCCGVY